MGRKQASKRAFRSREVPISSRERAIEFFSTKILSFSSSIIMKTTTLPLFFLAALSVSATPTPPAAAAAAPQIMSVADNQAYTLVVHLYTKEGEENINKVKAKLQEASQVYSKDRETLSWYVPTYLPTDWFFDFGEKKGKQLLIFFSFFQGL